MLVTYAHLTHKTAWLSTMVWIGVYNYFALKNVWNKNKIDTAGPADPGEPEETQPLYELGQVIPGGGNNIHTAIIADASNHTEYTV